MSAVNKLKHNELFIVGDILRQHCRNVSGFAIYEEGWNDEKVITEMAKSHPGIRLTLNNIMGLRKTLLGPLPEKKAKATIVSLDERLTALEEWATSIPANKLPAPFVVKG